MADDGAAGCDDDRRGRSLNALALARLGLAASGAGMAALAVCNAQAQVLQIDDAGAVTTYSAPMVFTRDGASPIIPPRPAPARRVAGSRSGAGPAFSRAASASSLSLDLIAAVAWKESGFRSNVVSRKGAVGEMQLMPATARALGVDPADAGQNVMGGAAYLRVLMKRYDGDLVRTLAAYNAGTAAVDRYGGVPPYRETQTYVAAVLDRLSQVVVPVAAEKTARR